ncbi:MAG: bifunctional DNA-formamidopyrimidine glycosylase/DNA-(apurinic or apyrimidinic site) lyase [Candidatus Spechtbacterales bacterium]
MPEIIEAEITKQKLTLALKGKRILNFWTDWPKGLYSEAGGVKKTKAAIEGSKIKHIERMGKAVVIKLEGGNVLALHQRMSGHIRLMARSDIAKYKHAHFKFELSDGNCMALIDPRKFGTVWFGSEAWFDRQNYIKNLGHDVLRIDKIDFVEILASSSASVKSFLLKQDKLAGLGNIACDEILWKAKINPERKVESLTKTEASKIYSAMHKVLADVLRHGGTSMSDWYHPDGKKGSYQDNFKIYKKTTCSRCGSRVKKIKIAGRGTYFCPVCQK